MTRQLEESFSASPALLPESPRVEYLCHRVLIVSTAGTLDGFTEPAFSGQVRRYLRAGLDTLVLNLEAVTLLDTLGAVALLECAHRAHRVAVSLRLVPSHAVKATLCTLGITARFTCLPSVRHCRVITYG